MDNNNQAARPPQPIRDVSPPRDNLLGNPTQFANVPVESAPSAGQAVHSNNPIAGGSSPIEHRTQSPIPQPKTDDLDRVLKDVNKDVKAAIQKPRVLSKPTLAIIAAVIVGIALMTAAFFAFRKPS